ncbi:MAG: YbcC family protein [Chloroflexaceae bacterium]
MSLNFQETQSQLETIIVSHLDEPTVDTIREAVNRAEQRIAPLWPLRYFVAVNPYLGLLEQPFAAAAQMLGRRAGVRMTAPRSFYAQAIRDGRITDADLEAALIEGGPFPGAPLNIVDTLKAVAMDDTTEIPTIPTVADVAHAVTGIDWAEFVTESLSTWAGAYFDLGQSYWKSPWADLPPYAAWRAEAAHDRTPQARGVHGFRQTVREMPDSTMETIIAALNVLKIPADGLDAYLHRLLLTIHGWASYARYHLWEAELYGGENQTLTDLLAIRLVWEVVLLNTFAREGVAEAWQTRKFELCHDTLDEATQIALAADLVLQRALEKAYQRQLFARLGTQKKASSSTRKQVQAVFCIDVRSEVFRRALETVTDAVETLGFAGFFGFPIEYVRLGNTSGGAQCPVLLTPQFVIAESVSGASDSDMVAIAEKRAINQRVAKAWRMFKFGPVSCFGFVGPVGLAYVKNLVMDILGRSRPVPHPAKFGLDSHTYEQLSPSIAPREIGDRSAGMTLEQRLAAAEGGLKAMSLTSNFARIVMLAGHGSTTVNNPHATGLDCGACGGHTGEANARVAVQILNDAAVRDGLKERGIVIPDDTVFVAALHDTTTDEVTIFDKASIPASHAGDLKQLEANLATAGNLARTERSTLLRITEGANVNEAVKRRSKDWSQVRPEWGLAGCAAFIVAQRERTAGIDLDGRSFLHSYDWRQDEGFGVLELIMIAPMVVASWINLQYYGSTVDNKFFGSGNKVLHNVVGTLGVLEGNTGDLRVGLPWQSVHDGENYIHEPLRLHVIIEAPIDAMTDIIAKHEQVRQLVDNGWLYLFALDDNGKVAHKYVGGLNWMAC